MDLLNNEVEISHHVYSKPKRIVPIRLGVIAKTAIDPETARRICSRRTTTARACSAYTPNRSVSRFGSHPSEDG